MTAIFERIKGEIDDLTEEEIKGLIRELLIRQVFLGLDGEVTDTDAILALVAFLKGKIDLLAPSDKEKLIRHLQHGRALRQPCQTKRCAYCWSRLRG